MSLGMIIAFGLMMSTMLGVAVYYYSQAMAARNSAMLLSRVSASDMAIDELQLGTKPQRLAKSPRLQAMLKGYPFVQELADLLETSGRPITVAELLWHMVLASLIMAMMSWVGGSSPPAIVFVSSFSAVIPILQTMRARSQRAAALEAQLPHALELINLYLRAGRSLPQSFLAATEELTRPASEEFAIAAEEYRLGRPLDVALKRLAFRYPTAVGLRLTAVAVSVLGQTGGNLVEVLERIKRILDATVTYGLKVKSMTSESRNSATILGITPGLFMAGAAVLNPEYFNQFFATTGGLILFGLFLLLWVTGIIWIRILVRKQSF